MDDTGALGSVRNLGPQLERHLEVSLRRRRRHRVGGSAGSHRCHQRTGDVVRGEPMVGEHRDPIESRGDELGPALHRLGVGAMELRALTRQEILVDRRARQRMTEAVAAPRRVDHEQLVLDRLAQRCVKVGVGELGDEAEQLIGHPATSARGGTQYMLGGRGQALGPGQQDITQRRRQVVGAEATLPDRAEQLLDEQRDPLGALEHDVGEVAVGPLAHDRRDLRGDLAGRQSLELDSLDGPLLLPARRDPPERMRARKLVGAHREHEQQRPRGRRGHEQRDQIERGPVGPLDVLDQ